MATGTHESPTYTANRLLYLYTLTPFIIAMVFIAITTTICLIVAHVPKLEEKLWASAKIPILAYIPSSLGAVQIMVFKVGGFGSLFFYLVRRRRQYKVEIRYIMPWEVACVC